MACGLAPGSRPPGLGESDRVSRDESAWPPTEADLLTDAETDAELAAAKKRYNLWTRPIEGISLTDRRPDRDDADDNHPRQTRRRRQTLAMRQKNKAPLQSMPPRGYAMSPEVYRAWRMVELAHQGRYGGGYAEVTHLAQIVAGEDAARWQKGIDHWRARMGELTEELREALTAPGRARFAAVYELAELTAAQRAAFELDLTGRPPRAIALAMDTSAEVVRDHLRTARSKLALLAEPRLCRSGKHVLGQVGQLADGSCRACKQEANARAYRSRRAG